eukprot:1887876-Alexandrium_andersonii.AAC.1
MEHESWKGRGPQPRTVAEHALLVQVDTELDRLVNANNESTEPVACRELFSVAAAIEERARRAEQERRQPTAEGRQQVGVSSPYVRLLDRVVDLQAVTADRLEELERTCLAG